MYDPIMGVGKTPQITQDVTNINPYGIVLDDITPLIFPRESFETDWTVTAGSIINPITNGFDYVANVAYSVHKATSIPARTANIIYDLGKSLSLRGIVAYALLDQASGTGTVYFEGSNDGTTYETFTSYAFFDGEQTTSIGDKRLRYLRIRLLGDAGSVLNFTLNRLQLQIDSNQLIR
jgi:hypothetical protein